MNTLATLVQVLASQEVEQALLDKRIAETREAIIKELNPFVKGQLVTNSAGTICRVVSAELEAHVNAESFNPEHALEVPEDFLTIQVHHLKKDGSVYARDLSYGHDYGVADLTPTD